MKNFVIFLGSFLILLTLFQITSGYIFTFLYQPDIEKAWTMSGGLASEVTLVGRSADPTMILVVLAAVIAYFVPIGFERIKRS